MCNQFNYNQQPDEAVTFTQEIVQLFMAVKSRTASTNIQASEVPKDQCFSREKRRPIVSWESTIVYRAHQLAGHGTDLFVYLPCAPTGSAGLPLLAYQSTATPS
jgi:hypothetical protein